MKTLLLYSAFFLWTFQLFAQHPVAIQLTDKDGLPDIEFYDILEDRQGIIWLAADKGLYSYDGKEFKHFTHKNKRGLSVFGLSMDAAGRVWCNNITGQYFYIENNKLQLFVDMKAYTRGQLAEYSFYDGELLVNCGGRSFRVDLQSKKVRSALEDHGGHVSSFIRNDTLFYVQGNAFRYRVNGDPKPKLISSFEIPKKLRHVVVRTKPFYNTVLLTVQDNTIFKRKLYLLKGKQFVPISKEILDLEEPIINLYLINDTVWIATPKGLRIYTYKDGQFTLKHHYFQGKFITAVVKDKNENYWIGTLREGVYIIPNIEIEKVELKEGAEFVNELCKLDDTRLLIGDIEGNVNVLNRALNTQELIYRNPGIKVSKLGCDISSKIYLSFGNSGVALDKHSYQVLDYPMLRGKGNAKGISSINDYSFVYGAFGYAEIVDLKHKTTKRIGDRRTYATHYNGLTNEIFVAYVDGLQYYQADLQPRKITFNEAPIFVVDIANTQDGTVWVSTFKDGILGIRNGKVTCNYTAANGLLSNRASGIFADGNFLWVVSDKGIQCLDNITGNIRNLTVKEGLGSFNIADIVVLGEQVYFATNKGLFRFDKERVFKKFGAPEFYIRNVLVDAIEKPVKTAYDLESDVKKIVIGFHANGHLSEENTDYYYRLLGASDTWTTVSKGASELVFDGLSPGAYTVELKAVERFGLMESKISKISVNIAWPWYQKWWFIALMLLLLTCVVTYYFKQRLRTQKAEQLRQLNQLEREKEMVFLKLENLRSQMNPHFIFNALNSIQDYILLNQKNLAGDYLGKFADLIRMYLNHSAKGYISLEEEIEAIDRYLELEKLRFEDALDYEISCNSAIDPSSIAIPTMLIQPYVENSLKHGLLHKKDQGILKILFEFDGTSGYLQCTVEDNGIGRARAQLLNEKKNRRHKSFATKATQDRLELLNFGRTDKIGVSINDLITPDGKASGTQVIIRIPYKQV
ncbi:putative Two-component sensor histidine kinase [Tenacibaculum litopenaei]|uniref:sensor histidine kinase n=1 Tax=Tenacibaculum litopenaei TaxID=396016 RepID=UPI003892DBFF